MKRLTVRLRWTPQDAVTVAEVADDRGSILLEYDRGYLDLARDTGLDLAPLRLPARPGLHHHPPGTDFGPLPGLLDDSLPDGWGLLLMDRALRRAGIPPAEVSPLDRLAWLGSTTMGALTYHPPSSARPSDFPLLDLAAVASNAVALVAGTTEEVLPALQRAGGSPGGARPKVLVGIGPDDRLVSGEDDLPEGFTHWLVKFAATTNGEQSAAVEHAYLRMAAAAGITACESRVLPDGQGGQHLAVRRFDRRQAARGTRRLHVATASGLLHASHRVPSLDYRSLLTLIQRLTRDHSQVEEGFRRMVFNVAAHNRDDHTKNVSFTLGPDGVWALAPAYDLTLADGPGGEHSMDVAGVGRGITRAHVLDLAGQVSIRPGRAQTILSEVCSAVAGWASHAEHAGVDRATIGNAAACHHLAELS